jgi:hypothetical protein
VVVAVGVLGYLVWRAWYLQLGPGRVVGALALRWLELPGAELRAGAIRVHHGDRPLAIQVGRASGALWCTLETRLPVQPFAVRIAPAAGRPPALEVPVERAPEIEARFAGTLRVEANDHREAARWLTPEAGVALAQVTRTGSMGGLTFDGERLVLHLGGHLATDPERACGLFREIWAALS